MSLYRCASCGSPNVMYDTQTGGVKYNYVKGAIGTVVLGTGGAVAGISNQAQGVYKCPDCGLTLTYPMPADLKLAIDMGVMSAEAREHLTFEGISLPWDMIVKRYKNIESGWADAQIQEKEARAKRKEEERARYLAEIGKQILIRFANSKEEEEEIDYDAQQKTWDLLYKDLLAAKQAEIEELESSRKAAIEEAKKDVRKTFSEKQEALQRDISDYTTKKENLEAELNKLGLNNPGFFKFSEKKRIGNEKRRIEKELSSIKDSLYYATCTLNHDFSDELIQKAQARVEQQWEETFALRISVASKKYDIPESPREKAEKRMKWDRVKTRLGKSNKPPNEPIQYSLMVICEYGEDYFSIDDLRDLLLLCFGMDVSRQRVSALARRMVVYDEDDFKADNDCVFLRDPEDGTFYPNL